MIRRVTGLSVALGCALFLGCEGTALTSSENADTGLQAQGANSLDPEVCALDAGGFTLVSTNPYFPMDVGDQSTFVDEEDDETLLITVLNQTRTIGTAATGIVTTRVIEEREWAGDDLVEVSYNYFAQASDGTICYFGEDVDIYEDEIITHEGAWCAEDEGNAPGIFMPADPHPGQEFPMELAPGIALDRGMILGSGRVTVPFDTFTETIRVRESNPFESGLPSNVGGHPGFKTYAADFGLIIDASAELTDFQEGGVAPTPPITVQNCGQ